MLHQPYQLLNTAAAADHADADCFVCVFLTHGETGEIYASDDKINIKEVTDMFRGDQCKSLVGKPKIFIFQVTVMSFKKYWLIFFYNSKLYILQYFIGHTPGLCNE